MSGSATTTISLVQIPAGPSVALYQGTTVPLVAAPTVNPLALDPSQVWTLSTVGTVSSWVEVETNPACGFLTLEDGSRILLEDGAGAVLLEL